MVSALELYGKAGLRTLQDSSHKPFHPEFRGMLTSFLVENDGWGDVSHWPIISTTGLARQLKLLAFNPWPFRIRVSASVKGYAVTNLCGDTPRESDRHTDGSESASPAPSKTAKKSKKKATKKKAAKKKTSKRKTAAKRKSTKKKTK